jgi:hypothetical protein
MSMLFVIVQLCTVGDFILNVYDHLVKRKKRKDDSEEKFKG